MRAIFRGDCDSAVDRQRFDALGGRPRALVDLIASRFPYHFEPPVQNRTELEREEKSILVWLLKVGLKELDTEPEEERHNGSEGRKVDTL